MLRRLWGILSQRIITEWWIPSANFLNTSPEFLSLNLVDPFVPAGKGFFNLEVSYRFNPRSNLEFDTGHIRSLRSGRI